MSAHTQSLFEGDRMTMADSLELTAASLRAYGGKYRHWACAFSGGKDSTATVTVLAHLIETGQVPEPESMTFILADTGMELTPLLFSAKNTLAELERRGFRTMTVVPEMDHRFFVYMFGRGVPPPAPHFRWCTGTLKVNPMMTALRSLSEAVGEKFLMLTGVRIGESAARDQRIALSCSRDGAECGQGYFQQTTPAEIADTLAPIVHWRLCHVWDWLWFEAPGMGFDTQIVSEVYGQSEAQEINARTGCIACNVASRETALDNVLALPQWAYLQPLKRLKPLYAELRTASNRLRKAGDERYADGTMVRNPMRLGPLTFDARRMGLAEVLGVQSEINEAARRDGRPEISLIDDEERARIEALIAAGTWPHGWDGTEVTGDVLLPAVYGEGLVQPLLSGLEA
jgi:DNA sulfur modification protein DndC